MGRWAEGKHSSPIRPITDWFLVTVLKLIQDPRQLRQWAFPQLTQDQLAARGRGKGGGGDLPLSHMPRCPRDGYH